MVSAKPLIPSMVLVLGTDSDPVPADRRCCLPAMAEIARQVCSYPTSWQPKQLTWIDKKKLHPCQLVCRSQVCQCQSVQSLVDCHRQLVPDSLMDWKPVKFTKHRYDVDCGQTFVLPVSHLCLITLESGYN